LDDASCRNSLSISPQDKHNFRVFESSEIGEAKLSVECAAQIEIKHALQ
jgi:hypothetical protein